MGSDTPATWMESSAWPSPGIESSQPEPEGHGRQNPYSKVSVKGG